MIDGFIKIILKFFYNYFKFIRLYVIILILT